jgi:hypothetical protein
MKLSGLVSRGTTACLVAVLTLLIAPKNGRAQVQQSSTGSPIDDLLTRAQQAFNDLNYLRADSLARQVLAAGRTNQDQRTRAMLVIAAAYFPEEVPAQKRDSAIAILKQALRADLDVKFPQDLTWAGLDSLLAQTRRTMFTVALSADSEQVAVGQQGAGVIGVRATRAAKFRITLTPAGGGARVYADSALGTSATMRFPTMRGERPAFSSGDYDVSIFATDSATGDTLTLHRLARIASPPLAFVAPPIAIDSSRLLAERAPRYGQRGLVVGGALALATYGFSNLLHADAAVKSTAGGDSKGLSVAAVAGLVVIGASYMDKGAPIPSAIASNRKLHDDLAAGIRDALAENIRRVAIYRVTITMTAGAR